MFVNILVAFASCTLFTEHEEKSFVSWMRATNQLFTGDEYNTRFGVWMTNARFVQSHNQGGSFLLEMNTLAALTPSEYKTLLGSRVSIQDAAHAVLSKFTTPNSVDWRENNAVTAVKDQGMCSSCWAFSAIAAAEGSNAVSSGKLVGFSESNLIDCVSSCYGCYGGSAKMALDYVIADQMGMFMSDVDYPYKAVASTCKFDSSKPSGKISERMAVEVDNENDLAAKCAEHGPVAVVVDASYSSFQLYKSGVYDEPKCSPAGIDHGMCCVGYGTEDTKGYWIVKNSWGKAWGEEGYIRMIRKGNQCGIASLGLVVVP